MIPPTNITHNLKPFKIKGTIYNKISVFLGILFVSVFIYRIIRSINNPDVTISRGLQEPNFGCNGEISSMLPEISMFSQVNNSWAKCFSGRVVKYQTSFQYPKYQDCLATGLTKIKMGKWNSITYECDHEILASFQFIETRCDEKNITIPFWLAFRFDETRISCIIEQDFGFSNFVEISGSTLGLISGLGTILWFVFHHYHQMKDSYGGDLLSENLMREMKPNQDDHFV